MTELKCESGGPDSLITLVHGASIPPRQRRHIKPLRKPIEHHEDFVALVRGDDGKIEYRSSALFAGRTNIMRYAYDEMKEICMEKDMRYGNGLVKSQDKALTTNTMLTPTLTSPNPSPNTLTSSPDRPAKRNRSDLDRYRAITNNQIPKEVVAPRFVESSRGQTVGIQVGDHAAMEAWFRDAFRAVQQVGCRLIAKLWIKKIHPKKQSTHPYNGGYPRDMPRDPDRTRPSYWPEDVVHKEPDHIDRAQRTKLLVHLIITTPHKQIITPPDGENVRYITSAELLEALEERKSDFKAEPWKVIREIIRARSFMEQYQQEEIDGSTVINLMNLFEGSRRNQGDSDEEDAIHETEEEASDSSPTQNQSSVETSHNHRRLKEQQVESMRQGNSVNVSSLPEKHVKILGGREITFPVVPDAPLTKAMAAPTKNSTTVSPVRPMPTPLPAVFEHQTSPQDLHHSYFGVRDAPTMDYHPHDLAHAPWSHSGLSGVFPGGPLPDGTAMDEGLLASYHLMAMHGTSFRPPGHEEMPVHNPDIGIAASGLPMYNDYGVNVVRSLPIRPGSNPYPHGMITSSHGMQYYPI